MALADVRSILAGPTIQAEGNAERANGLWRGWLGVGLDAVTFAALPGYYGLALVPVAAVLGAVVLASTWAVVALAVVVAVQLVRPWLRQAIDPENLRTE